MTALPFNSLSNHELRAVIAVLKAGRVPTLYHKQEAFCKELGMFLEAHKVGEPDYEGIKQETFKVSGDPS